MAAKEWYGARTVYRLDRYSSESDSAYLYEERIVVVKAASFDDAIAQAEKEASTYATGKPGIAYLGFVNVFRIVDDSITNNTEVYSLVRESTLLSKEYLDRFFDTGSERTKSV
ncbi:DUF4288 domain-containing protein [Hymenobacter puniceus]|uniref:DUF4288 domain-containing protein n=1 Tax=Hymenobacter sp. BT190 TaxID=2763505 RepID=UPI001650F29D|nr:DUF4288 domain-containing protein [Hymenobacter sp. BT190]MBC6699892.1 DUF4288 domain-containing protein [Hymenobacter sp. BT190]